MRLHEDQRALRQREEGQLLDDAEQRLADDEDQSWRLRNRVWGQMIYPLALAILALAAALLYAAGLILTKKGNFSSTLRAVGFAQVLYVLTPLALLPLVGPLIRVLLALALFVSTWIGAAEAHQARGWRTVLLPVIAFLILGTGYLAVSMLLSGAEFTLSSVFTSLGISAP